MRRALSFLCLALTPMAAGVAQEPEVTLTRLDCGRAIEPWSLNAFDDTGGSSELRRALVVSCYLIRHGETAMIWDTGIDPATSGDPDGGIVMERTLVKQLAELDLQPEDIAYVGLSHYHYDHTGQAQFFPSATLLVGRADWDVIARGGSAEIDATLFEPWLAGGGKVTPISGDLNVFGDGTVTIIDTPGHTPGHHSLLVRLKDTGPVLLTGDLVHFTENLARDGVPAFNTDRADTLASIDRFKKMATNLSATVIIQHEPADVAKLPAFPEAAR